MKLQVTSVDLHHHFHALGAGTIEDVRVQRDKGFGFVRYSTHAEAALAIQMGNARFLFGKPVKVHCYRQDSFLLIILLCYISYCYSFVLILAGFLFRGEVLHCIIVGHTEKKCVVCIFLIHV